jgi:hypothetical protein
MGYQSGIANSIATWALAILNIGVEEEKPANDEVERRGAAPTSNEADLSGSSTLSLIHRKFRPAIARTDC